jgi:hypothetical protein
VPHLAHCDENVLQQLDQAKKELTGSKYSLRYKYLPGETITNVVEQLSTVDTTIAGNNQQTKLRTRSTRSFRVEKVSEDGTITFSHQIDHVTAWCDVTGRETIQYDSSNSDEPPAEFQHFAEQIGKPISVITMNNLGVIVARDDKIQIPDIGMGGLSIPMPTEPISIGHSWSFPIEIRVREKDSRVKAIQTRELYTLEKVETGVATISIKTQVLTPIDDPHIKAQLIQRISQGTMRFDVEAGRLLSKQLDWDSSVLGFAGANSNMKYLARVTEELSTTAQAATTAAGETTK